MADIMKTINSRIADQPQAIGAKVLAISSQLWGQPKTTVMTAFNDIKLGKEMNSATCWGPWQVLNTGLTDMRRLAVEHQVENPEQYAVGMLKLAIKHRHHVNAIPPVKNTGLPLANQMSLENSHPRTALVDGKAGYVTSQHDSNVG